MSLFEDVQILRYSFVFALTAPSAPPANITITEVTAFSLLLRWDPPPFEHQNGILRQYHINITEENTGRDFQIRSPTTEFRVQFLHPHYSYSLTVAALTTTIGPSSYPLQVVTSTARKLPKQVESSNYVYILHYQL